MTKRSRQYPLNKHQADKFSVQLEDLDFKTAEERALANKTPQDQNLNTGRSRARKALDFGRDYGSSDPPRIR